MDAFVNKAVSINWRASLVPAAAVVPAPVAYADVVDVKKLVVDCILPQQGRNGWRCEASCTVDAVSSLLLVKNPCSGSDFPDSQ